MNIRIELCFELPFLTKELMEEFLYSDKDKNKNIDKRTDLFATIMALYPYMSTDEISKRTGVSERVIKEIAVIFGIRKNKQFRSEINRRNGDHPKKGQQPNARPVEKVTRNGRVVATYRSTVEAADANRLNRKLVSDSCRKRIHKYRNGYLYRYKEL